MRNRLFTLIARIYPTHLIDRSKLLNMIWRWLFYAVSPSKPFLMSTRYYSLIAHPKHGTLTRAVIRRGYWEKCQTEAFVDRLKTGGVCIDVGANFGHYALVAANLMGEESLVVAFEPQPQCFALLKENTELVPYGNLVVEQAALGDEEGRLDLFTNLDNPGGHSFSEKNVGKVDKEVVVQTYTLDKYLSRGGISRPVDIMKIDVEGFEFKVLQGARNTIRRDRPVVFCEVSTACLQSFGNSYHQVLKFFSDLSYRFTVFPKSGEFPVPLSHEEAADWFRTTKRIYFNVIFDPV